MPNIWQDIVAVVEGAAAAGTGQNPIPSITSTETQGIFGGLFGGIAGGIEAGVVSVFKDIWLVIGPFVEIAAGVLVAAFAIGLMFKDDLLALAPVAAAAAL